MLVPKVCHSVCPRDKRKQCVAHPSPEGSPPPAGFAWDGMLGWGQGKEGEGKGGADMARGGRQG